MHLLAQTAEIDLAEITAQDWITAGVVVVATIVLATVVRRVTSRLMGRLGMDAGPSRLVGRLVAFLILVGGFVYALNALDIAVGPLLGALGVGGLALAFALQDIIENFIAGLMLQTRRPFRIGDQVVIGGYEGTVEDVNLRTTILRTFDGRRVYVPSADVLKSGIENNTAFEHRRTALAVGVGYDTDLDTARQAILRGIGGVEGVVDPPATEAWVESFGGSSIDFCVRFWHRPAIADEWRVRHAVAVAVKKTLDDAQIEIPYPIRTIDLPEGAVSVLRDGLTPRNRTAAE